MNNENPELKPIGDANGTPQIISSDAVLTGTTPPVTEATTELLVPDAMAVASTPAVEEAPSSSAPTTPQTRYNPVTGEEMNVNELKGEAVEAVPAGPTKEEKYKQAQENYQPTSKGNTVMLIIFFIFLVVFVVFLPDIQTLIAGYKAGPVEIEEIKTGKLVCTLSSNTVNLDREITRTFEYTDEKLQSAKFSTVIRGDATLDEEALNELNDQCEQIKTNVASMTGINVSCNYENGKLTEKETFDYATYNIDEISAAYAEAGGTVMEFIYEQDINTVMTNMRQGGFTCNKEK